MHYEQVMITRSLHSVATGQLRLCIYSPLEPKENVPGVLWIHGGDYGLGTPEQDEGFIREFVLQH